ncbi:MAG: thiamine-phosphate kinase [Acidobacteriota bacterium]
MRLSELGEDRFLEKLQERVARPGPDVRLGIGDDAAALAIPAGEVALVSTDVLVEGVHFTRRTLAPRFIGRKAVAVNGSDIAAMGGRPLALLLSLTVPAETEVEELLELLEGLTGRARELKLDLVGGNLSASPGPMIVDVTIVGTSIGGRMLRRTGARPGEALYVSGKLGAAAEGLELLKDGMVLSGSGALLVPSRLREGPVPMAEICLAAHMDPEPRIDLGQFLCANGAASACLDVSDGLARDLGRLCRASGVGARVTETALPVHPGLLAWERVRGRPPLELALSGGEDYELLFTVSDESALEAWRREGDVPVTRIGTVTEAGEGVTIALRGGDERVLAAHGWDHFQFERSGSGVP